MAAPNYATAPCSQVRVQPASPQFLTAVDSPASTVKGRWIISASALYLLEQVYKIENYPSLHMRQRLATDLGVSQRQVGRYTPIMLPHAHPRSRARAPLPTLFPLPQTERERASGHWAVGAPRIPLPS